MTISTKKLILPLIIFLFLFCITPFVSKQSGCFGSGPNFGDSVGCAYGIERQIVFPAYRTAVCMLYSEPGCAPDTLLPGWYEHLLNYENAFILLLLILISIKISSNSEAHREVRRH